MAKRKNETTDVVLQHTSTSEAVKTRPRKRRNNATTTVQGNTDPSPKLEEKESSAITSFQPLALPHLDELAKIWDTDKRIPTLGSRRAWAHARNLKPAYVHAWFSRRKQIAKKARQALPQGTYELLVGTPPVIKEETPVPPPELPGKEEPRSKLEIKTEGSAESSGFDVPSSDTLVATSPAPEKKTADTHTSESRTPSPLPPSSPPPALLSPAPELPHVFELSLSLPSPAHVAPLVQPHRWCTQGCESSTTPSSSEFTCALCTIDPDLSPPAPTLPPISSETQNALNDYTQMALSALPFLLRSPDLPLPHARLGAQPRQRQWCLDGRSYSLGGSFVSSCLGGDVCASRACLCLAA